MVGCYDHVGGICRGKLLDEREQLIQRLLHRLENLFLGVALIAGGIDPVVIDIHYVMTTHQLPALFLVHCQEVFGAQRFCPLAQGLFQDL